MHLYHLINHRVSLFLLLLLVLFSTRSFPQYPAVTTGSLTASKSDILAIRKAYQRINSASFSRRRFTYDSMGCVDGGEVIYFFDKNKEIVKIKESGFIGDGSWVNEYYFSAGKVIFCLETREEGPASAKPTETQFRYYIKNDLPIRELENNKITPPDENANLILQAAKKFYRAYKTKDFVSAAGCN